MNRRQRKKENKRKQITIILGCKCPLRDEDRRIIGGRIKNEIKTKSVIVLPPYLHVEAVIQQPGSRNIEIKQESEEKQNELQTVEKEI